MSEDKVKKYYGLVVPMVTPITEQGEIDTFAAEKIINHLIKGGVTGVFVLGTTGEAASISPSSKRRLVEITITEVKNRAMTYAGISGNCLEESIEMANNFFDLGVDAVVAHLPYYYLLNDSGMLKYYEKLADSIEGPLMLYNIPITTYISIPLKVVEKLSHHTNIIALKDSEGNEERLEKAVKMWRERTDFSHFTGSSGLSAKGLLLGSDGIVPSAGNFIPQLYQKLYEATIRGDSTMAYKLQEQTDQISSLYLKDRTLSESIAALKVIMSEIGLCKPVVFPPLMKPNNKQKNQIKEEMAKYEYLKRIQSEVNN